MFGAWKENGLNQEKIRKSLKLFIIWICDATSIRIAIDTENFYASLLQQKEAVFRILIKK